MRALRRCSWEGITFVLGLLSAAVAFAWFNGNWIVWFAIVGVASWPSSRGRVPLWRHVASFAAGALVSSIVWHLLTG